MPEVKLEIKIDEYDKQLLERVCEYNDIDIEALIDIFIKKVCSEQRIPFDLSIDYEAVCENIRKCGGLIIR